MSDLDEFMSNLTEIVVQRLAEENTTEEEIWQELGILDGIDCKQMWIEMREITIKKLDQLLLAEDRETDVPEPATMLPREWLLFNTVLVHQDIDFIGQKLPRPHNEDRSILVELFQLVDKFNIDNLTGSHLADAWIQATTSYVNQGRRSSPMLLQRRWHQLKEATKLRFNQALHSCLNDTTERITLSALETEICTKFRSIITQPIMAWEEMKKQRLIALTDDFVESVEEAARRDEVKQEAFLCEPDLQMTEPIVRETETPRDDINMDVIKLESPVFEVVLEPTDITNNYNIKEDTEDCFMPKIVNVYGNVTDISVLAIPDNTKTKSDACTHPVYTDSDDNDIDMIDDLIILPHLQRACSTLDQPMEHHMDQPINGNEFNDVAASTSEIELTRDPKLLMRPIVYTTSLDNMDMFRTRPFNHIEDKQLIDEINKKSKPVLNQTIEQYDLGMVEYMPEYDRSITSDDLNENVIDDIQNYEPTASFLQKPAIHKYTPIQLCKNPDFVTKLKKLSMKFLSLKRNRVLMNLCKPLTIDLSKAFESKLVCGTLYLKPADQNLTQEVIDDMDSPMANAVSLLPSAISAQSLIDNSQMNVADKQCMEASEQPAEVDPSNDSNTILNAPNIAGKCYFDQRLLTTEITSMQVQQIPVNITSSPNTPTFCRYKTITTDKNTDSDTSCSHGLIEKIDDSPIVRNTENSNKILYAPNIAGKCYIDQRLRKLEITPIQIQQIPGNFTSTPNSQTYCRHKTIMTDKNTNFDTRGSPELQEIIDDLPTTEDIPSTGRNTDVTFFEGIPRQLIKSYGPNLNSHKSDEPPNQKRIPIISKKEPKVGPLNSPKPTLKHNNIAQKRKHQALNIVADKKERTILQNRQRQKPRNNVRSTANCPPNEDKALDSESEPAKNNTHCNLAEMVVVPEDTTMIHVGAITHVAKHTNQKETSKIQTVIIQNDGISQGGQVSVGTAALLSTIKGRRSVKRPNLENHKLILGETAQASFDHQSERSKLAAMKTPKIKITHDVLITPGKTSPPSSTKLLAVENSKAKNTLECVNNKSLKPTIIEPSEPPKLNREKMMLIKSKKKTRTPGLLNLGKNKIMLTTINFPSNLKLFYEAMKYLKPSLNLPTGVRIILLPDGNVSHKIDPTKKLNASDMKEISVKIAAVRAFMDAQAEILLEQSAQKITTEVPEETTQRMMAKNMASDLIDVYCILNEDIAPEIDRTTIPAPSAEEVTPIKPTTFNHANPVPTNDSFTRVTFFYELKYACRNAGKFYKLDLETGKFTAIHICMKGKVKKVMESVIDLTADDDELEQQE